MATVINKRMSITLDFYLIPVLHFIFSRNAVLQICFCIVMISFFEWRNCIMYIQDSVPFSEYCLLMCLGAFLSSRFIVRKKNLYQNVVFISVPMYVIGIIETQFFAYLQLIRYRLSLLNKILIQFGKIGNSDKKHSHYPTTVDEVTQIKSNSFEYFVNNNNPFASNEMFKAPSVHCIR